MALWLVRAGKHGEHEQRFFDTGRIYLTWEGAMQAVSLADVKNSDDVKEILSRVYPNMTPRLLGNHSGQISAFVVGMSRGDWIVVPRKTTAALAIGEIKGDYAYENEPTSLTGTVVKSSGRTWTCLAQSWTKTSFSL